MYKLHSRIFVSLFSASITQTKGKKKRRETQLQMAVAGTLLPLVSSPPIVFKSKPNTKPKIFFLQRNPTRMQLHHTHLSPLSTTNLFRRSSSTHFTPKASSSPGVIGTAEQVVEPATNVEFKTSLSLPGCSTSLGLLGTGYREKIFAIIGVKVYAAGFYATQSAIENLNAWKGQSASEIEGSLSLFNSIFQVPQDKLLQIVLVRDVDGKTFWDALDEAISPRIKAPTSVDESALSTFRRTFEGRPLKKGTFIFLTWPDTSKMLVSISSDGLPSKVDATIESANIALALFDVFFGDSPVSPSLKASVSNGLATILR